MQKIAEVIVDVPTLQTNNPYEFKIPSKFQNDIAVGMRVIIPFGKGNRRIQGFVTAIKDDQFLTGN